MAATSKLSCFRLRIFALVLNVLPCPAIAARAPVTFAGDEVPINEVVVTGTRIAQSAESAGKSIITVGIDELQASGQVNIESALGQMPQFAVGAEATNNPLGGGGYASVNLRGLGEQRNLVLLDGKRLPMASARGVVDINAIPVAALDSVEIATGGASAIYGADAVSGVVNFRLRDSFEGLEFSGKTGISQHGGGRQVDFGAIVGKKLAGARGQFMAAAAYTRRGVLTGAERCSFYCGGGVYSSYLATGRIFTPFSAASPAAVSALFNVKYGITGSIPTLTNFGVNNDGSVFAAIGGANLDPQGSTYVVLPFGNVVNQATGPDNYIVQPQQRLSAVSSASFEVSPGFTIYLRGLYSDSRVQTNVGYPISGSSPLNPVFQGGIYGGNMVVSASNPFIPADLAGLIASRTDPNAPIYFFKRFTELGRRIYRESYRTWQVTAGVKGKLSWPGWNWEVYFARAAVDQREQLANAVLLSRVQSLLNAPDGGKSICEGGYNPFGSDNMVSAACRGWLSTDAVSTQSIRQDVAEASLNGVLTRLQAGDLRFSLTATWRRDSYAALPDCHNRASADADCTGINQADIAASVAQYTVPVITQKAQEISGELLVPLARDGAFAKSLSINLGGRWSHYSSYGNDWTWRAGVNWQPLTGLIFRGGYERAARVPSFAEAAIPVTGNVASLTVTDPCSLTSPATRSVPQIAGLCLAQMSPAAFASYVQTSPAINAPVLGSSELRPEHAMTYTLGMEVRPKTQNPAFHRLSLSVDYYAIRVANAIGLYPLAQTALAGCFNLDPSQSNPGYSPANSFCQLISRNGAGIISSISQPYVNFGAIRTAGIDIALKWEARLAKNAGFIGLDSNITRLLTYKLQSVPSGSFQEYSGSLGAGLLYSPSTSGSTPPQPLWRVLSSLHYRRDAFEVKLRWRYISGMSDPNAIVGYSPARTPNYSLFDLGAKLAIGKGLTLRWGINNLFDRKPPIITFPGMTMASVYDVSGRYFHLSAQAQF